MRINTLLLNNFRKFKGVRFDIPKTNFIVLIGKNGVGKSSILDALSFPLAFISGKLTSEEENDFLETMLQRSDITNGRASTNIEIDFSFKSSNFSIATEIKIDQSRSRFKFDLGKLLEETRQSLKTDNLIDLPILIYYRINRTFSIEKNESYSPYYNSVLEGYRNCFSSKNSGFSNFEEWFISEENLENQQKISSKNLDYEKPNLKVLREGISLFLNCMDKSLYTNLRVERNPESNIVYSAKPSQGILVIDKDGLTISINQLSSGEKMIIFLVADIARRLLILNHNKESSLQKEGIVLIDEIEMHLHPNWQRNIVKGLQRVFPSIQFIVSTHSPQVIANLESENILELGNKEQIKKVNYETLGVDSNSLLESVFNSTDRPDEMEILINNFHQTMEKELPINDVEAALGAIKEFKNKDKGLESDSLIDDLTILLSAYKFEQSND